METINNYHKYDNWNIDVVNIVTIETLLFPETQKITRLESDNNGKQVI